MPFKQRYLDDLRNAFIEASKKKKRSEVTTDGYDWMITKVQRELFEAEESGEPVYANPKKWDEETIYYIRDVIYSHCKPRVVARTMSVLNTYASFHGNSIIKDMNLEWPSDDTIIRDQLSPQDALRAMEAAEGLERIVMHLELNLGLRRVEIIRLRVQDIGSGFINVRGKGRQGGKWRTMAFHKDTLAELEYLFKLRDAEIAKARYKNPSVMMSDELLIHAVGGELIPYQRSGVDRIVERVARKTKLRFTNHTLRRTYGRNLWMAGVPIETIADLMGHKDTKTTIKYLGLKMDDKESAMARLAEFMDAVKHGKNQTASVGSGQRGI